MTVNIIKQYDKDFKNDQIYNRLMYIGCIGAALTYFKPKNAYGCLGAFTLGVGSALATMAIANFSKNKFNDFVNDYQYKHAPKLMDRKVIPLDLFNRALDRLKSEDIFQDYLTNEKLNEKEASERLYKGIRRGFCQGQSFELLLALNSNYALSCNDLLEKINVETAKCFAFFLILDIIFRKTKE